MDVITSLLSDTQRKATFPTRATLREKLRGVEQKMQQHQERSQQGWWMLRPSLVSPGRPAGERDLELQYNPGIAETVPWGTPLFRGARAPHATTSSNLAGTSEFGHRQSQSHLPHPLPTHTHTLDRSPQKEVSLRPERKTGKRKGKESWGLPWTECLGPFKFIC